MGGRIENPYEVLEGVLAGVANARDLPLALLEDITEHFSEDRKIGQGGFGTVYKGLLPNGEMVAVKKILRAIPSSQMQFENEVNLLMKLKHQNVVRLVGYCYETRHLHMPHEGKSIFAWDTESLLCLECLPNGSLDKYISDASSGLNWHTRFKIIEGISYGLQYLHEHSNEPIIHLDLKPANILLDAKMLPKITDFGLSRLFDQSQTMHTAITRGTLGYMSPEFLRGIITPMSDIFSLGVIIMEVITGHRDYPYDIRKYSEGFILFELQIWRNRLQKEPGYTSLETDCQQIERCIQIGLICVNPERTKRPTMKKIISLLEGFESMNWYISDESKSGLDMVPQTAYPHVQSPVSSPVQVRGDWSVLEDKTGQVIPSEVAARHIDHDYKGRATLSSSKQFRDDVSAQASQHDSHAAEFDFDTWSQNPPFEGLSRSDVLDGSLGAEALDVRETSGDSPNLASGLKEAKLSYPYLLTLPEESGSSFSEEDDSGEDDPLPGIEGLRITGEAFPGQELQACGYSTDGTTSCNFEWVRHLDNGFVKFIEGARQPNYLVTADDVDTLLVIEVQPLDDRKIKGEVVKVYANDQAKITCDPETKELIKNTLEAGHVSYQVQLQKVRDMWEPAVLSIKRKGYSIKCNVQHGVVLKEKFQQVTAINIPPGYERATEFVIVPADGHEYILQPAENSPPRDTIVLVLRLFRSMAVKKRRQKKKCIISSRSI